MHLQESSNEGTEADHGASGSLEVGGSTCRVLGGASARGSLGPGAGSTCTRSVRARARARGGGVGVAVGGSDRARCGLVQDDGGGGVGADDKSAGRVTIASNRDSVDTGGNSRDGGRDADISVSSWLGGDNRVSGRLGGNGSGSCGLASHDTQGVGLLEESGLGEGVD